MAKFTPVDYQKAKLEKLMKNIDKPIEIPERKKGAKFAEPPEFVRNIMGSSAGAGSGEFHVYRHLRRKEYARQRFIDEQARREELDRQFKEKLEANKQLAEEKTAKKRQKRLKKKSKLKAHKKVKKTNSQSDTGNKESSDEENSDRVEESDTKEASQRNNTDSTKKEKAEPDKDADIGPKVEDFLKCKSSVE